MAEDFAVSELIIPGTYIRVRADALIGVGGISTGNIGIVGTAETVPDDTVLLSDYETAKAEFGMYDPFSNGDHNLTRGIEILFRTGARTVYARAVTSATTTNFTAAFNELLKDEVNILVAPELSTADAIEVLSGIVDSAETDGKDVIAVVGAEGTAVGAANDATTILGQKNLVSNKRIILTTPGIVALDAAADPPAQVDLPGTYGAAAVAGLLSTLTPQTSPTNKVVSGVGRLTQRFSYGEMKSLVQNNVLVLEQRQGVRVVRGVTTDDGPFKQITTRRITDFAKAGIRKASNPFIGRLNNQRVRKALYGAIDGFLTTMVQDEALIAYSLEVTATRTDEINGRAIVNAVLQPTFSIDYVAVTLVLE
ncbi:MAG: phage tail sheath C-terminal domain-containing protein [Aggregatilineales bacterium]